MKTISMERFRLADRNSEGWCKICENFTTSEVEPDAEDVDCPICETASVIGAQDAMVEGLFEVEEN